MAKVLAGAAIGLGVWVGLAAIGNGALLIAPSWRSPPSAATAY
jgi:hypothetical protein